MNMLTKFFLTLIIGFSLTACKIDLTINGDGAVSTASGSFACGAGNTGDCTQHYATQVTDCPGYSDSAPDLIPADCTLIVEDYATCVGLSNATASNCIYETGGLLEIFTAIAGDNSQFINWTGDNLPCNGEVNVVCDPWISEGDASTTAEVSIVANFIPDEVAPQEATYQYNYLGQRKSKTVSGITTYFAYNDMDGQLLGEYTAAGAPIREYVYVDGERVAVFDYSAGTKQIIYLAPNHLGQVVYAWNSNGDLMYQRIQTPFGETMGEYGTAGTQMPVRFPGQYYDAESGFSDNWHRTYDPSIGRYLQSDPIGLEGGINTYGYVNQNPVMFVDPLGLNGEAAIAWATSKIGSTDYQKWDTNPESHGHYVDMLRGRGGYKCNAFSWEALVAGGDPPMRMSDGRIPSASEWTKPIAGYHILTSVEPPKEGDVVSDGHHMGLFLPLVNGEPGTVSASSRFDPWPRVVHNNWGFRDGQRPTIQRCDCDK